MKRVIMGFLFIGILGVLGAQGPYTLTYDLSQFTFTTKDGYDRIQGEGMFSTSDTGAPELPVHTLRFIIPADKSADSIIILNKTLTQIPGEYNIYPVQPPVPLIEPPVFPPFVPPDSQIYSKDALYPGKFIEITHKGVFDGARIVEISVYPIQYNPVRKNLYLVSSIQFQFSFSQSVSPLRPQIRKKETQKIYDEFLNRIVYNKSEISSYYSPPALVTTEYLYQSGYPEVVIITTPEMAPAFEPLAEWLTEKGMLTFVRTTDWVYSNYDGIWDLSAHGLSYEFIGDNAAKIKEYLLSSWLFNGLTYAILAGSDDVGFPFRYCTNIPSDLYFQDFTGNWDVDNDGNCGEPGDDQPDVYPEIFVGRILCGNLDEAKNWVEKRLTYEKNPANRNLMLHVVWHGQSSVINYGNYLQEAQNIFNSTGIPFVHHEVIDHPSNPSDHRLVDTFSMGYQFLFIDAHGYVDRWRTSDEGFNVFLSGPDDNDYPSLDELYNSYKYYVVYSISCDVAAFDLAPFEGRPSVAAGFINKYRDKILPDPFPAVGSVAFLGNTRYGWFGYSHSLRNKFLEELLLVPSNEYRIGPAESFARTYFGWWYIRYTHNLFGSPEMQIYTDIPRNLVVYHPRAVPANVPTDFVVTVVDERTLLPIEGAVVTLYKPGETAPEIYKSELTDAEGKVVFTDFTPPSTGVMKVTVTKHNYIPYQKDVQILDLGAIIWKTDDWRATAENNGQRVVFNPVNRTLYAAFTKSEGIYFTYSSNYGKEWSNPVFVTPGKNPVLSVDANGKVHMVYTRYNLYEELLYRSYDPATSQWGSEIELFSTSGTNLWWIGPPSASLVDDLFYITWESPFSQTIRVPPWGDYILIQGTRAYLGKLDLTTLEFTYEIADQIMGSEAIALLVDSLGIVTRSPSIATPDADHILIFWDASPKFYSAQPLPRYFKLRIAEKISGSWTRTEFGLGRNPSVNLTQNKFKVVYVGENGNIYFTERWISGGSWTTPLNLSETSALCDNPVIFGNFVAWTQYGNDYSDIILREYDPVSGWLEPENLTNINLLYSKYPQILLTRGSQLLNYYLHIIFTEGDFYNPWVRYIRRLLYPRAIYSTTMDAGTPEPSPYTIQRDTFYVYGDAPYQSVDVAQNELIYKVTGLGSPGVKYYIRWQWYQKEADKIKLQLNIDDIFHHNKWVYYDSLVDITSHIPEACLNDSEIVIKVKVLNGPVAVLSGFQIIKEEIGGGGPQSLSNDKMKISFGIRPLSSNIVFKKAILEYSLPAKQKINLSIFDVMGRKIKTLVDGTFEKGIYTTNWDLKDTNNKLVGKGVYFIVLKGEKERKIQKLIVVK